MLNKITSREGLVKSVNSKEEKHIKFYSPRSGKRYRFYYQKFIKRMAKYAIVGAVIATVGVYMVDATLRAWDVEHEIRMERQRDWMKSVVDNSVDPDLVPYEVYEIIKGKDGN